MAEKVTCTTLTSTLYMSIREGHVGVAKLLLEAGADVETPDNYGQSPFFMACWKGHADVAALLLEYDANKDCRTKTGITPLFQVRKLMMEGGRERRMEGEEGGKREGGREDESLGERARGRGCKIGKRVEGREEE